jgi:hypothetical protein
MNSCVKKDRYNHFCLTCNISCWKTDIAFPMSSFCDLISFSITIQPRFTILGLHIDHGVCISPKHVSPDIDLIFRVYWLKFMSSFCDQISYSITIQPRFTILGLQIDHGGFIIYYAYVNLAWIQSHGSLI